MAESILQNYLTRQHIKVTDEKSIANLKNAITEVKKILNKKKQQVIPYTLVALDPKIKDSDPVVQQVENIIIKKWSTFKNSVTATKDKSTTYIRAVILESLNQLAKSDATIAALVWHTSRDVVRYYQLGTEKDSIANLLQNVADTTEAEGQVAWGINRKIQSQEFKGGEISISTPKSVGLDEDTLITRLKDAMVHSAWSGSAGGGTNPQTQAHNSWQWPKYAAEKSASGIAEVVNSALSEQSKSLSAISNSVKKSLDEYFALLQPYFEELNSSFAKSIAANNKRGEILWWKQALYSPSLNTSYRDLGQLDTAVLMALDLADQVDPIYPVSVDFLLRETLKDIHGEQIDESRPLADWVKDFKDIISDIKSVLAGYAIESDERKTLLVALANIISDNSEDFFIETGIDKKTSFSLADLSVWLFHGLQAHTLATSK